MKLKPTVALSILGLAGGLMFANQALAGASGDAGKNARLASLESFFDTNQGQVRSFAEKSSDWFNKFSLSAMVNADYTSASYTASDTSIASSSENTNNFALANLNLFADYEVNDWVRGHVGFNYFQDQEGYRLFQPHNVAANTFGVDEAYVLFSNLSASPVYMRAGQQYVDFGNYKRFPKSATLTQLLSQTDATALTVGMVHASGLQVSGYLFNGNNKSTDAGVKQKVNNGGLHVGYSAAMNGVAVNVSADYLNNMVDVDYVARSTNMETFVDRTGAYSLHADLGFNSFDAAVDFVSAASDFNSADLEHDSKAAKPSAVTVGAGYSFAFMNDYQSRVGVSYQRSREASELSGATQDNLPKTRYTADYDVMVGKMTTVGLQVRRDKEYNLSTTGDSGRKVTTGVVRLGVNFA
jgi:hypothetical protein